MKIRLEGASETRIVVKKQAWPDYIYSDDFNLCTQS